MKRFFTLSLTILMIFSLAACNKKEETTRKRVELTGTVNGTTYESRFIGIGCKLDSYWTFKTDEELRDFGKIAGDTVGKEYHELLSKSDLFYDMHATGFNKKDSININLQKLSKATVDKLDLNRNYEKFIPAIKPSIENQGYKNVICELDTITIGDQSFPCMRIEAQHFYDRSKLYKLVFSVKCDIYLANITITTYSMDYIDNLIDCFYLVN